MILKPLRIFVFGLALTATLTCLALLTPDGGWKIGQTALYFPNWWQSTATEPHYKDIRDIIASVGFDAESDTTDSIAVAEAAFDALPMDSASLTAAKPSADSTRSLLPDSTRAQSANADSVKKTKHKSKRDSIVTCRQPFEFPDGNDTIMLNLIRRMLDNRDRKLPIRILHYGDSQIESDRITATIRNFMQRRYGGIGCGYLPVLPAQDISRTFQQDIPPHWKRFSIQDRRAFEKSHSFGIAGAFVRYMPVSPSDTITHIGLKPIGFGYMKTRSFSQVRMLYGGNDVPAPITVNRTDTQMLKKSTKVSSVVWNFQKPQRSLRIDFLTSVIPDVYGLTLDGTGGVAVDNMPLRGSSGLEFAKMDMSQLRQMYAIMNVGAVVLQFGANAVMSYSKTPERYADLMKQQIADIRSFSPGMLIIVVGASDLSQHGPNGYQSYPGLDKIVAAQRKVAFENGCVFWDLQAAMGGENSMPSWVTAKPPLANKDFVHFTLKGAQIVGELFCKAWSVEEWKVLREREE